MVWVAAQRTGEGEPHPWEVEAGQPALGGEHEAPQRCPAWWDTEQREANLRANFFTLLQWHLVLQGSFLQRETWGPREEQQHKSLYFGTDKQMLQFANRVFFQLHFLPFTFTKWGEKIKKEVSVTSCIYFRWFMYALYSGATAVKIWEPSLEWDSKAVL